MKIHPFLLFPCLLMAESAANAAEIALAVAANFSAPMEKISAQFQAQSGHKLLLSYGASGKFYTQIKQGAPFDVFLSADQEMPVRLAAEGDALPASRLNYAIGKLVLWSPQPGYVDAEGAILKTGAFKHLAFANPQTAPYGHAAMQVMQHTGVWDALQERLVRAENIGQAYQFASSGNAELGFVALSQIMQNGKPGGSYWLVPSHLHQAIVQQAILLQHGKDKPAAQQFLEFLKSPAAQAIILSYGYALPAAPN